MRLGKHIRDLTVFTFSLIIVWGCAGAGDYGIKPEQMTPVASPAAPADAVAVGVLLVAGYGVDRTDLLHFSSMFVNRTPNSIKVVSYIAEGVDDSGKSIFTKEFAASFPEGLEAEGKETVNRCFYDAMGSRVMKFMGGGANQVCAKIKEGEFPDGFAHVHQLAWNSKVKIKATVKSVLFDNGDRLNLDEE